MCSNNIIKNSIIVTVAAVMFTHCFITTATASQPRCCRCGQCYLAFVVMVGTGVVIYITVLSVHDHSCPGQLIIVIVVVILWHALAGCVGGAGWGQTGAGA